MKILLIFGIIGLLGIKLSIAQAPENNSPRFGNIKKSQAYIDSDNQFIAYAVKQFGTRHEAAIKTVELGWNYLQRGDDVTAMKRFNQAWLLDSTLVDTYWGFGAIMGMRNQLEQSIYFMKRYYDSNPQNERIMVDLSISYLRYAMSLKQKGSGNEWPVYTNKAKQLLKKTLALNSQNANANQQLAITYYHENKLDSSKYYALIANRLDPKVLNPKFKEAIGIK